MAVAVGVAALGHQFTNIPASLFAMFWAVLYIALLARIIIEAVHRTPHVKARLERRRVGALLARALPWPERVYDMDDELDLTVRAGRGITRAGSGSN